MHTNNNDNINSGGTSAPHPNLHEAESTSHTSQALAGVMPVTPHRRTRFALLPRMKNPARAIKHFLQKILPPTLKYTKNTIESKIAQRIEQLKQNHTPFTLTEKIKLFSELHQEYAIQHAAINAKAEDVIEFINTSFLEHDSSDLTHDPVKKELEGFLEQQIKDFPITKYDELKQFLNQEKITHETKNFDKKAEGIISHLTEEIAEAITDNFKPTVIKEFIEEILSIDLQKLIENFLLHKETPHLFKKIVLEEINANYMSNHNISNFLMKLFKNS